MNVTEKDETEKINEKEISQSDLSDFLSLNSKPSSVTSRINGVQAAVENKDEVEEEFSIINIRIGSKDIQIPVKSERKQHQNQNDIDEIMKRKEIWETSSINDGSGSETTTISTTATTTATASTNQISDMMTMSVSQFEGSQFAQISNPLIRQGSAKKFVKERILYYGPNPYFHEMEKKPRQRRAVIQSKAVQEKKKMREKKERELELKAFLSLQEKEGLRTPDSGASSSEFGEDEVEANILPGFILPREFLPLTEEEENYALKAKTFAAKKDETTDSDTSITAKLCEIKQKSIPKPKTLRERYLLASRHLKGHSNCIEKAGKYPVVCYPIGQFYQKTINSQKQWGIPYNTPLKTDQLMILMEKIRNHETDDYVVLKHSKPINHILFNPYGFSIIPERNPRSDQYYTLSRNGLLNFSGGNTEFTSMTEFEREIYLYEKVKRFRFFVQFIIWKSFIIWRYNIRHYKLKTSKINLEDMLFITKRPLRQMLIDLNKMSEKISSMGFLNIRPFQTYTFKDFLHNQEKRMNEIKGRLRAFERMVVEMTQIACRSCLMNAEFSADEYKKEMEYYKKILDIPPDSLMKPITFFDYPGQWLTYSKAARKRHICERLTQFIHLIDFKVHRTYHELLRNSMYTFLCELNERSHNIPKEFFVKQKKHQELFESLKYNENMGVVRVLAATHSKQEAILDIGCEWTNENLILAPSADHLRSGIMNLLEEWKKIICSYSNMTPNEVFNPYTQAIINGYMEPKICGEGPNLEFVIRCDENLMKIEEAIEMILNHGFQTCLLYCNKFDSIRLFCIENDQINLDSIKKERDIKVFAGMLEKFQTQMKILQRMENESSQSSLGVFRVNNQIIRNFAYPYIMRCLSAIHDTLPEFGGRYLADLNFKMQSGYEQLSNEPNTLEEHVIYILFLDEIQEKIDEIEEEVDNCAEIYDLILLYEIPGVDTGTKSLDNLQPLLMDLRAIINEKMMLRENYLQNLIQLFQGEDFKIFSEVSFIRENIEKPIVLDPNSNANKMYKKMKEYESKLRLHREKAERYNSYKEDLQIQKTDYQELDVLIEDVAVRRKLWEIVLEWNFLIEEWNDHFIRTLNTQEMIELSNEHLQVIQELEKSLPENLVSAQFKENVQSKMALIPIVIMLQDQNGNMKKRHWDAVEKETKMVLSNTSLTFRILVEMDAVKHSEAIKAIVEKADAEAEFNIETLKASMTDKARKGKSKESIKEREELFKTEFYDDEDLGQSFHYEKASEPLKENPISVSGSNRDPRGINRISYDQESIKASKQASNVNSKRISK